MPVQPPSAPTGFAQVQPKRVFEEICEQIRAMLASGSLKPGDRLPAEREFAVMLNVSRPAVREAMRTLERSGVVRLSKGTKGGAFICEGSTDVLTRSLQDLVLLGRVSIQSLAEARACIHVETIRLACQRSTDENFDAMAGAIEQIEASGADVHARTEAGVRFLRVIAEASRNEVLVLLVDSLGQIMRATIDRLGPVPLRDLQRARRRILGGLRARDTEAAVRAMYAYLSIVHSGVPAPPPARSRTKK